MSLTTLIFLGLMLTFWRLTQIYSDEVIRFLSSLAAVTCLIVGVAAAPVLLKSLILLFLVLTSSMVSRNQNFS